MSSLRSCRLPSARAFGFLSLPPHLRSNPSWTVRRTLKTSTTTTSRIDKQDIAFAFDIDGVLLKHRTPIPGATRALQKLQNNRIPFILLTNGGGKHESDRVAELSQLLDVEIREDMFLQSHTPFKDLVGDYSTVLVVGGDEPGERSGNKDPGIQAVAERYGFRNIHTPNTLLHQYHDLWPFESPQLSLPHNLRSTPPVTPSTNPKFDAVLVFNDPRHWGPCIQLILDVLLTSNGKLGTLSSPTTPSQVDLWWSNPDLLWQSTYPLPRLGQGGFRAALEGVYDAVTEGRRGPLKSRTIGKPHKLTYEYAERVLQGLQRDNKGGGRGLGKVYMVGDNPYSDIRGANGFGWESILVKTGVYRHGEGEDLKAEFKPKIMVEDVGEAVERILEEHCI